MAENDAPPVALSPETHARHAAAVDYVEQQIRTRAPLGDRSRFPGVASGAWGLLANGDTITAASGTTLGAGSVKLCDREGAVYPEDETVAVSNTGAEIEADGADRIVRLGWTAGEWCVTCPGGG